MALGCSMPAKSNNVGAISHNLPASNVADFKVSLESEKQNKKNIEIVEDFGKME